MLRLAIIDIDQTMFHTDCIVNVVRGDDVVRCLSSSEFNNYQLQDGEDYDFSDFRSAESFCRTARPIKKVHAMVRNLRSDGYHIVYLTARGMVDNVMRFMSPFAEGNVPMAPIIFSGEYGFPSPVENKRVVIREMLRTTGFRDVVIVDDHHKHLDMALSFRKEFDNLKVTPYLVDRHDTPNLYIPEPANV